MNIIAVIFGGTVFIAAAFEKIQLARLIFGNPVSLTAVIIASVSLLLMWVLIRRGKRKIIRVFAACQVTMILLAVGYMHFPYFIMVKTGANLSLLNLHAPGKTINDLGWALTIGSFLILPSLFYLFFSFQKKEEIV